MPNKNLYKFGESPEEENPSSTDSNNHGLDLPIKDVKDIGGIPLPKNEDMGKWITVVSVIVVLLVLFFIGSWINSEMKFKNEQIKACNENFQNLNVKYVLKDQELQQYKKNSSNNQQRDTNNTNEN